MTAREPAAVRRRLQLLDDPARTDPPIRDSSEDGWVEDFISRLAGKLRNIGAMRRKGK